MPAPPLSFLPPRATDSATQAAAATPVRDPAPATHGPPRGGAVAALPSPVTLNCFTVDVEEYFHCEVFAGSIRRDDWPHLACRSHAALDWLNERLAATGNHATFFVLGWSVRYLAGRLRELVAAGHELACHGHGHVHLSRLNPQELREDLRRARGTIEDATGVSPRGYRAPTFSITRGTAWALDVLLEAGFKYDSSIFPVYHDRYGVPGAPDGPFLALTPAGGQILEFPPLTVGLHSRLRLPVGGGGYLRLLPGWFVRSCIARRQRWGEPTMLYIHPWELDPDQPRIAVGRLAQWRHRVGLRTTARKLDALLNGFRFETAARVLAEVRLRRELPAFALNERLGDARSWQPVAKGGRRGANPPSR